MIVSAPVELVSVEELECFLEVVSSFVNTVNDILVDSIEDEGNDAHHCGFEDACVTLVALGNLERVAMNTITFVKKKIYYDHFFLELELDTGREAPFV